MSAGLAKKLPKKRDAKKHVALINGEQVKDAQLRLLKRRLSIEGLQQENSPQENSNKTLCPALIGTAYCMIQTHRGIP